MTTEQTRLDLIADLHERIVDCRACHTAGYVSGVRPLRHPWSERQRTMIVGQAPGSQTEARRFHFAGPGGLLLGRWLAQAGYDPDGWREQCYITSLTRCFPGKAPKGSGDRKPSPAELALCRPFLEAELRLIRPRVVLAVGGMAIEHLLGATGKRPLHEIVGEVIEIDGRPIVPLPHPSGVSRWLNAPANRALVDAALARLSELRQSLDL
ncbi:MAG: uracil-DNA glycosylase [Chloroflexi bacterium]|nr:uracil-DNA glycosylase [Chloroflexota bacterium]